MFSSSLPESIRQLADKAYQDSLRNSLRKGIDNDAAEDFARSAREMAIYDAWKQSKGAQPLAPDRTFAKAIMNPPSSAQLQGMAPASDIVPLPKEIYEREEQERLQGKKKNGIFRKVEKGVRKSVKHLTPVIGAAAGNMLAPGVGGTVGGALAGSTTRGGKNKLKGALRGAAIGTTYTAASDIAAGNPILGKLRGLLPSLSGLAPSALEAMKTFLPAFKAEAQEEGGDEGDEGAIGSGNGYPSPQQAETQQEEEASLNPLLALTPDALELFEKLHGRKDTEREKKKRDHDEKPEKIRQYKSGGFTGHIDEGDESGIADNIPKKIPDKSYVWDATSVSLLGDGSSKNGIKKLKEFESRIDKSGVLRGHQHSGYKNLINAKVSRDEYVMKPKTVAALGGGDFKRGAHVNDMARQNLRRQKGVSQKILPPNAKDVGHYFKGGY